MAKIDAAMARLRLFVIGIAFLFAATASAQPSEIAVIDPVARAAIDRALHWIAANSAYRPVPLRRWEAIRSEDMASRAWWLRVAAEPSTVYSMYSCAHQTLYFQRGADFDDPVVFSFLVHEVTHHLQCASPHVGTDLCAWEREAYRVQGAYLRSVIAARSQDGRKLSPAQLSAAKATADDLGNRAKAACAALYRQGP
jgi:hypothetical protein